MINNARNAEAVLMDYPFEDIGSSYVADITAVDVTSEALACSRHEKRLAKRRKQAR